MTLKKTALTIQWVSHRCTGHTQKSDTSAPTSPAGLPGKAVQRLAKLFRINLIWNRSAKSTQCRNCPLGRCVFLKVPEGRREHHRGHCLRQKTKVTCWLKAWPAKEKGSPQGKSYWGNTRGLHTAQEDQSWCTRIHTTHQKGSVVWTIPRTMLRF